MSVLAMRFGIPEEPAWRLRFNIAPTQAIAAIRHREPQDLPLPDDRGLAWLRWGLIPSWADDPKIGHRMINARSETVREKPSFRTAFRSRRCLVLADASNSRGIKTFAPLATPHEEPRRPSKMWVTTRLTPPLAKEEQHACVGEPWASAQWLNSAAG